MEKPNFRPGQSDFRLQKLKFHATLKENFSGSDNETMRILTKVSPYLEIQKI